MTKTRKRITRRIVNAKRRVTGYVIAKKTYSVAQTRQMAQRGQVVGVRVVGNHIQAVNGRRRLSDLPFTVQR